MSDSDAIHYLISIIMEKEDRIKALQDGLKNDTLGTMEIGFLKRQFSRNNKIETKYIPLVDGEEYDGEYNTRKEAKDAAKSIRQEMGRRGREGPEG